MSTSQHTPVVPLEAGASPDNPPCPACEEPLFGWLAPQPGLVGAVSRCESCGLGLVGGEPDPQEALQELDRLRDGESLRIANRASFAAALGSAGWAGLTPGSRYLFTTESVRRLIARRDQVVASCRWVPGASVMATWGTLLNSVTFGHNVALAALGGGAIVAPADKPWKRNIDALASIVLAIPAMIIALPIELAGGVFRRGAVVRVRTQLL
jgi:hypothetical protein